MATETLLFWLRVGIAASLYGFLMALFYFMWRNMPASTQASDNPHGRLLVVDGHDDAPLATKVDLQPMTVIGRSSTCHLVIDASYASAEHARISWRQGQWWIEDLDSRNGTHLNDYPVQQLTVLSHGDVIRIGSVAFRFESR